ncbi:hypothetical protein NP493_204g02028, partial [Ridgeia piscesae]
LSVAYVLLTVGGVLVIVALVCFFFYAYRKRWWCNKKKKSNDYFYVNYNRGQPPSAVPIATIARPEPTDHVDLTTTDVNLNGSQYVVDGRQLYVINRAVSVDRLPTKGSARRTRHRQHQYPSQTMPSHRTMAYANGGYAVEPAARTVLQPTGYYVANGGVAQVHAGPPTSARTANSYPKRWRTHRSLPHDGVLDEFRPLSRASSGHLTTMSTKSNPDSLYLRWSPKADRRFTSDDVFIPPETDQLDNVSRSSYVIVNNPARGAPRQYQKPHKAFTEVRATRELVRRPVSQ